MQSFFSYRKIKLLVHFYKKYIFLGILLSVMAFFLKLAFSLIIALKFSLFAILWAFSFSPKLKQQLIFYKNFGISSVTLFFGVFLIDLVLTFFIVQIRYLF